MIQPGGKIRFERAHVVLLVDEDRKILEGRDMDSHDAHRGFIAVGWRPSQGRQHDAQQYSKSNNSNSAYSIRANFQPFHAKQHFLEPPHIFKRVCKRVCKHVWANSSIDYRLLTILWDPGPVNYCASLERRFYGTLVDFRFV